MSPEMEVDMYQLLLILQYFEAAEDENSDTFAYYVYFRSHKHGRIPV